MEILPPNRQGLYNSKFEHDNCGIGLITNIKGNKSHKIIKDALEVLKNIEHRGGVGRDINSGDGAGILIQIPHKFFKKVCKNQNINLPECSNYAVGMLFCSPDKNIRENSLLKLQEIIKEERLNLLGFREVPINSSFIGEVAKKCMPYITQLFIEKSQNLKTEKEFEKKLFIILKRAEKEIRYCNENKDHYFYFSSF